MNMDLHLSKSDEIKIKTTPTQHTYIQPEISPNLKSPLIILIN